MPGCQEGIGQSLRPRPLPFDLCLRWNSGMFPWRPQKLLTEAGPVRARAPRGVGSEGEALLLCPLFAVRLRTAASGWATCFPSLVCSSAAAAVPGPVAVTRWLSLSTVMMPLLAGSTPLLLHLPWALVTGSPTGIVHL